MVQIILGRSQKLLPVRAEAKNFACLEPEMGLNFDFWLHIPGKKYYEPSRIHLTTEVTTQSAE